MELAQIYSERTATIIKPDSFIIYLFKMDLQISRLSPGVIQWTMLIHWWESSVGNIETRNDIESLEQVCEL